MNDDANKWAAEAATNSVGAIEPSWWYEITSDGDWIIGSGNRGFALVNDESQAQIIVDRHNRAAHASGWDTIEDARTVILRGVELMSKEQVSQWTGVRAWLEQAPYEPAHTSEDTRRLDWIEANHHRFVTGNLPVTRKGIDAKMNKENAAHASEDAFVGECATGANPVWKAAHASEELIDNIMGDLVRETNIFPNQVERAKQILRKRLSVKKKVMNAGLKNVKK